MSTLTKICVVVLVVLVLLACPIFIQTAVTGYDWKKAFLDENAKRLLAEAKTRNEELVASIWRRLYEQQKVAAETRMGALTRDLDAKLNQLTYLKGQLAEKQRTIDTMNANVTEIQSALNQALALNQAQGKELDKQRAANIQLSDQLRRAEAKIEEYLSDIGLLKRARQVLEEQVAQGTAEIRDLKGKLKRLEESVGAVTPARATVGMPKVEATVTAIKDDIASLNVGSADGVKRGMEFIIYREDQFVAHLRVEHVRASDCSGIVVDALLDVKSGDKATTSLDVE